MKKRNYLFIYLFTALSLFMVACGTEVFGIDNAESVFPIKEQVGVPTIPALLPKENSEPRDTPITHVVIHFTSNVLNKPQNPYNFEDIQGIFIDYGVSAHYMIGRDGEVYSMVPEDRVAYHAGKGEFLDLPDYKDRLNDFSIGIELMAIGTKEEMQTMMVESTYDSIEPDNIGYTVAQYESLEMLLDDILARNPDVKHNRNHIIGHDEYAPERKTDPGTLFEWSRIGF